MKLRKRLENFKGVRVYLPVCGLTLRRPAIDFLSLQLRSTKFIRDICVTGDHVTSRNQGLSFNDIGRKGRESLETKLG